ncbi:hypothetical protein B0I26_1261, partial [Anoxybacillus vitaminiphilus]
DALLFCANDLPIMEKLGLQREEEYPSNHGYQQVVGEFSPVLA